MPKVVNIRRTLNYFSFTWFVVLYGCSLFAYFKTGTLPDSGWPDPKRLISCYGFWFYLVNASILVNFIALFVNASFLTKSITDEVLPKDFSIWFFAGNLLLLFISVMCDPYGFTIWFFD